MLFLGLVAFITAAVVWQALLMARAQRYGRNYLAHLSKAREGHDPWR
jgi:hypothetical protein